MRREFAYSGLGIAIIGFVVTRFLVVETVQIDTGIVPFLFTGAIPLVVGLSLTILGVGLAVGPIPRHFVDRMALWCILGTFAMSLVLGITTLDTLARDDGVPLYESGVLVANILLGGAVGGVIIGYRSAENRQNRLEMARQADQGIVLNRLLRHEILNATSIIAGYADLIEDSLAEQREKSNPAISRNNQAERSVEHFSAVIKSNADHIDGIIQDIGFLADFRSMESVGSVDIGPILAEETEKLEANGVSVRFDPASREAQTVIGDERIRILFRELLANAREYSDTERPIQVRVIETERTITVRIADRGPGLPDSEREKLEAGSIPTYDDPTTGFGLPIVRLIADHYGADVSVNSITESETGTTIDVTFARPDRRDKLGVPKQDLFAVGVAALVAGGAMGIVLDVYANSLPIIGALYGIENVVIGWITHLFHSLVFGMIFVAGLRWMTEEKYQSPIWVTTFGSGWGVLLWLFAAGIVMPVWLRLVGMTVPIPNLTVIGLLGHVIWGFVLGVVYSMVRSEWVQTKVLL